MGARVKSDGGRRKKEEEEEEERLVEAKETSSSSVKKKKKTRSSAKYPPTQKIKTKLHCRFSKTRQHSVHVLSVSQTKASLIQSALSCEGGGRVMEKRRGGQHVG